MLKKANIPNAISVFRILMFPFVFIAIQREEELFFILMLSSMFLSDFVDGFLARRWGVQSTLGTQLDSAGDIFMAISAVAGIVAFKWEELQSVYLFYIFISLYLLSQLVSLIRFKTFPSLHLYSFKLALILQAIFVVLLFIYGFIHILFVGAALIGVLACIEEIMLLLFMSKMQRNVKGLFWFFKTVKE